MGQGQEGRDGENKRHPGGDGTGPALRSFCAEDGRFDRGHLPPAGPRPDLLPALVHHRSMGFSSRSYRVVHHRLYISNPRRHLDVSIGGVGAGRNRRHRQDIYRKRRQWPDGDISDWRFRRDLFDGIQLFRWLASHRGCLLPQYLSGDRRITRSGQGRIEC